MYLSLDSHSGAPIYLQLKEQMRLAVATGTIQPGEQLPVVRELAAQLRVNPNTVARVYRELHAEGLLTSRQGSGTFVAEDALALVSRGSADLVRQRMRGAISLGLSVGMSVPQLSELFAEVVAEAPPSSTLETDQSPTDQGRPNRE
jgi:GntR family transcriptional regulator